MNILKAFLKGGYTNNNHMIFCVFKKDDFFQTRN